MFRTASSLLAAAALTSTALAQPGEYLDMMGRPARPPASYLESLKPAESRIDVVFVLDTTGSMGGLIEGAKQKIWSIANQIATAKPHPTVRMGLVAYRDRGDEYITKLTPLSDDLDAVYSNLMSFVATGGGDAPESVNQALNEALTKFDWDKGEKTLRLIYLVGDAPPHMDYPQDIPYTTTCAQAAKAGVIINTVQCGPDTETAKVWQEIARTSEGSYLAIEQSGGVVAIATPFDAELARLGADIDKTVIAYGTREAQHAQSLRMDASSAITAAAPASALAERAIYKSGAAGRAAVGGAQELVNDTAEGKVKVRELKEEDLPPEMQKLSADDRERFVADKTKQRQALQKGINDLNVKRQHYIDEKRATLGDTKDSFDTAVLKSLREQAAKRGITYPESK